MHRIKGKKTFRFRVFIKQFLLRKDRGSGRLWQDSRCASCQIAHATEQPRCRTLPPTAVVPCTDESGVSGRKATRTQTPEVNGVSWLKRLVAGLSPWKEGSIPGRSMWNLRWTKSHKVPPPSISPFPRPHHSTNPPYSSVTDGIWYQQLTALLNNTLQSKEQFTNPYPCRRFGSRRLAAFPQAVR